MEGKSFLNHKTEYMQFFSDSETENRQFFHFVHNDVVSLQCQRPDPSSALHDDFGIGKLPVLDCDSKTQSCFIFEVFLFLSILFLFII